MSAPDHDALRQMSVNVRWLIGQFDAIHQVVCASHTGTWQQRVEKVVAVLVGKEAGATATVLREVARKREAHVLDHGWTAEHDDEHTEGELVRAALCYAAAGLEQAQNKPPESVRAGLRAFWPFAETPNIKDTPEENYLVALSLIVAEVERLKRKESP